MNAAPSAPAARVGARGAADAELLRVQLGEREVLLRIERGAAVLERAVVRSRAGAETETSTTLEVDDLEVLARAVLSNGHHLRFCAHGASMQPQIPDGSWIEVRSAPLETVRRGDIAFYVVREGSGTRTSRWIAHRVIGRSSSELCTRGDSAWRVDRVGAEQLLGVVCARVQIGSDGQETRMPLETFRRRWTGLWRGRLHRAGSALLRRVVAAPLRVPLVRRSSAWLLQLVSATCTKLERRIARARRRIDVALSALLPRAAKDAQRRSLYESKHVRDFTALDENLVAGFTLLEEVLLARHPLPGPHVLVLGCGPGRECAALARRGFHVAGLDRDERMLERARELTSDASFVKYFRGEADRFELALRFDAVVIFSGLYNMLLPREARVAMLACARRHLVPGGLVELTFLSDYVAPGRPHVRREPWLLRAIEPSHEEGDLFLLNETVHVFPFGEDVAAEAREAGLEVVEIFRDQRGYDREGRQVRGYAVLRPAQVPLEECR